jgi:hypothetical protein
MDPTGFAFLLPREDDDDDVHWQLSTAASLWVVGERGDALKWLRRAARSASSAGGDARAVELFGFACELTRILRAERGESAPPPQPPPRWMRTDPPASSSARSPSAPSFAAPAESLTASVPAKRTLPPPHGPGRDEGDEKTGVLDLESMSRRRRLRSQSTLGCAELAAAEPAPSDGGDDDPETATFQFALPATLEGDTVMPPDTDRPPPSTGSGARHESGITLPGAPPWACPPSEGDAAAAGADDWSALRSVRVAVVRPLGDGEARILFIGSKRTPPPAAAVAILVPLSERDAVALRRMLQPRAAQRERRSLPG